VQPVSVSVKRRVYVFGLRPDGLGTAGSVGAQVYVYKPLPPVTEVEREASGIEQAEGGDTLTVAIGGVNAFMIRGAEVALQPKAVLT
jgi:hypothetical protein